MLWTSALKPLNNPLTLMGAIVAVIFTLYYPDPLVAQTAVRLNGFLRTDNRVRYHDGALTWNENRLNLEMSGGNTTDYNFFSQVWLRGFGEPRVFGLADLQRKEKDRVMPWGLELREAYLDLYGFGLPDLDLRVGRQIINWGTGDGFNPTSNISPDDLEDFLFFGQHLGVNVLKATYYAPAFRMIGVFVPVFTPATLPPADFTDVLYSSEMTGFSGTSSHFNAQISLPENTLTASSQFAFKVAALLFNFDVSASYYYGRYDLPMISRIDMAPDLSADAVLSYPHQQVVGGDFAGAIGDGGVWGEGAVHFPEKVTAQITAPSPIPPYGPVALDSTMLGDKPYAQYLIGTDYTFQNGWYVNLQYLHGFLSERGAGDLNDYVIFRSEKDFLNDKITLSPVSFALSVTDWNDPQNNYGVAGIPELTYKPSDNVDIVLGSFLFGGTGQTIFQSLQTLDEMYLRLKVSF